MPRGLEGASHRWWRSPAIPVIALALALATGGSVSWISGRAESRWVAATQSADLLARFEAINGLVLASANNTAGGGGQENGLAWAFDAALQQVDQARKTLDSGAAARYLRGLSADITEYKAHAQSVVEEHGVIELTAGLDPFYLKLRERLSAAVDALKREAEHSDKIANWLTWAVLVTVFGAGALVARWSIAQQRRRQSAEATEAQMRRFESMVRSTSDVISTVDAEGLITYASPSAATTLGRSPRSLRGTFAADVVHADDRESFVRAHESLAVPGATSKLTVRAAMPDGTTRHTEISGVNSTNSGLDAVVWTWRDVHDRVELESQLSHQAFHDPLTGLANRALLHDRAAQALLRAVRDDVDTTALFIDLDGFKNVNDSLGHAVGDDVVVQVANRLSTCIRPGDTLARLGGDEFAVLLERAGATIGREVADRIMRDIRIPVEVHSSDGKRELVISASVGVATAASGTDTVDELLRNADVAMYAAKSAGKDCAVEYEPKMHLVAQERLQLQQDLVSAFHNGDLHLHYQPIVDLADGNTLGFEALLRWEHSTRGSISPASFVPVAEESGSIVEIGRWVLGEAISRAALLRSASGRDLQMHINLSARQLHDTCLVETVRQALERSALPAALLTLEITETAVLSSSEIVITRLHELKTLGVHLALDDFGTGYCSLSYLQRLPIDSIKIDRSFVAGSVEPGNRGRALVETILQLGANLRVDTVAEGIENDDELSNMVALGCSTGQGFYFSRPLDGDAALALVSAPAVAAPRL